MGECITALGALNGSLVTYIKVDDQPVWRFKHPTIGDAYAATLAFNPELLEIFLNGSSIENLISQVTCGNVGIEKAVVVPISLFPLMLTRLSEFSTSDKYKVPWLSSWGARRSLYQFLARRCSKEFLALYLREDTEVLERISEPGLYLSVVPEVDLAIHLFEVGLLPEDNRKAFVETVSNYAIEGADMYALENDDIRHVFIEGEFEKLIQTIRTDLLPKLAEVRKRVQMNHDSSEPPDEHMQNMLDSLGTLKKRFSEDNDVVSLIDREINQVNEWIAETEPPEEQISPRTLGTVERADERHGTRSIFDDIDDE